MLLFLSWKPSPDSEGSKQSEASEEITPCDIFNRPLLESSHPGGKWGESNYRSLIWVPELNFNYFSGLFCPDFIPPHSNRVQSGLCQYRVASNYARTFYMAIWRNNHFHSHLPAQFELPRQRRVLWRNFGRSFSLGRFLIV